MKFLELNNKLYIVLILFIITSGCNSKKTTNVSIKSEKKSTNISVLSKTINVRDTADGDETSQIIVAEVSGLDIFGQMDTVFLQHHGRALYENEKVRINVMHKSERQWTFRELANEILKFPRNSEIEILENSNQKQHEHVISNYNYYFPNKKELKKSWIWSIDSCEYLLTIQIFHVDKSQIAKLLNEIKLVKLEFLSENISCGGDIFDDYHYIKYREKIDFY